MNNVSLINGSNLAYIGDAYYELFIRKYLISKGITKQKELTKAEQAFVSASAHSKIFKELENMLSESEIEIFKKGRNSVSNIHRKNVNLQEYLISTGFEALIGYLYLSENFDRLNEILNKVLEIVNL